MTLFLDSASLDDARARPPRLCIGATTNPGLSPRRAHRCPGALRELCPAVSAPSSISARARAEGDAVEAEPSSSWRTISAEDPMHGGRVDLRGAVSAT